MSANAYLLLFTLGFAQLGSIDAARHSHHVRLDGPGSASYAFLNDVPGIAQVCEEPYAKGSDSQNVITAWVEDAGLCFVVAEKNYFERCMNPYTSLKEWGVPVSPGPGSIKLGNVGFTGGRMNMTVIKYSTSTEVPSTEGSVPDSCSDRFPGVDLTCTFDTWYPSNMVYTCYNTAKMNDYYGNITVFMQSQESDMPKEMDKKFEEDIAQMAQGTGMLSGNRFKVWLFKKACSLYGSNWLWNYPCCQVSR